MINNKDNKGPNKKIEREYKNLAKNSFYSFIHSYSGFFFSILTSFIMARMITQESWGYLIISLSFIALFTLTLAFFPPSLGLSFNYYIPRYRALDQKTKLKSFIKKSLIIRLLFIFPIFFISLLIIYVLIEIIHINLGNYGILLYTLSPLIIINGLNQNFHDILRGFNKFKIVFFLLITRYLIHIGGLLYLFFNLHLVSIINIGFVILISYLTPFLINFFVITKLFLKIQKTDEESLSYKEVFSKLVKYGLHLSVKTYLEKFNREFKTILIGSFQSSGIVTGYNIAVHYSDVSFEAIGSFNRPLTISFSSLSAKNKHQEIEGIYKNLFQYTQFFILLMTGILFFIVDIYLNLIFSEYSESFSIYSLIMKFLIIAMTFNVQTSFFYSLLRASEKVKYIGPIRVISFVFQLLIFLIALLLYGIIGAMIGIFIGNFINFIFIAFLNLKLFKIKMDFFKSIMLFSSFFFALGFSLFMEKMFLAEVNHFLFINLNLFIFRSFQFLSLVLFLIIFLFLIIILDVFTLVDIQNLEMIFNRDNFIDNIIRRSLKILKKFMK